MNRLQKIISSGRNLFLGVVDSFLGGFPPTAPPALAAAGCSYPRQFPTSSPSADDKWSDWLSLAAPVKKPSKRIMRWKRRVSVRLPIDNVVQCHTCGGFKEKDKLCPTCLKEILVQSAEKKKEIEESWKAAPHNFMEEQRFKHDELRPNYVSLLKHAIPFRKRRNTFVDYEEVLSEVNKNPLLDRLPDELYIRHGPKTRKT